jgi:hypothetical protein
MSLCPSHHVYITYANLILLSEVKNATTTCTAIRIHFEVYRSTLNQNSSCSGNAPSGLHQIRRQHWSHLKGWLHLRLFSSVSMCIERSAVISCVFGVLQMQVLTALCNTLLHTVLHAALCTFLMCVFSVQFQCASKLHIQNTRFAASSVIRHMFCCTSQLHVIAADRLLHIQTAHPKRKCNRPLKAIFRIALVENNIVIGYHVA